MARREGNAQRQQNVPAPVPPSSGRDGVGLATLGGVVVLLMIAFANWRDFSRLSDRLDKLETKVDQAAANRQQPAPTRQGPDPNRVYPIKMTDAPVLGSASAAVTIAEFSDFQCPFCSRVAPTLKRIKEVYGDKVRTAWKHMPLDFHKDAMGAHLAAAAAGKQGKFWEFHDKLFANQSQLKPDQFKKYAHELGLDVQQFEKDLLDPDIRRRIADDMAEAKALGVTGTPGFFVNGRFLNGAKPFEEFAKVINAELTQLKIPVPAGAAMAQ